MPEPKFRRGRKVRQVSCRPLKLTDDAQAGLIDWYYNDRTVAQKARQLGISVPTLYAYVKGRHKPRKDVDLDALTEEVSLVLNKVPQTTESQECTPQDHA